LQEEKDKKILNHLFNTLQTKTKEYQSYWATHSSVIVEHNAGINLINV
jgi:hypothetical protein